jgi:hypothetical protein
VTFDPVAGPAPAAAEASAVVWLDALVANVDRTARNSNLLAWHRRLWLIVHGAALWFHHAWDRAADAAGDRFAPVKDHVLLPWAAGVRAAGAALAPRLGRDVLERILVEVPDAWLAPEPRLPTPAAHRAAYVDHLSRRLSAAEAFVEEAERARALLV